MRLSRRILFLSATLAMVCAGNASAQNGVITIQQVGGLVSGTTVQAGANIRFLIKYQNDTGQRCNVSNGFKITSPDGVTWDSTTIDSIGPIDDGGTPGDPSDDVATYFLPFFDFVYAFNEFGCDGIGEDSVGFLAAGSPTSSTKQMPTTWNDSVFAITAWFNGDVSQAGKHICIDSATWFEGGSWKWVGRNLVDYFPLYIGLPGQAYSNGVGTERFGSGYCFDIYAPGLELSVDSLGFSAVAGGATPPAQNFSVNSTGDGLGDHLSFSLVEASPWLLKTPSSGTTPRSISVSVNITGLTPGVYVDSIEVVSAGAYNSPLYEKVTLTVAAPAPTISVNKTSFNFVALTGGANPPAQSMIIKNTGGGTLNWSATYSSLWLTVAPNSGVDSEMVSVSVDITSMGVGDFYDTIVVTDPAATNDPVRIPVKLSLGSSLPMIAVDSQVNHIIVDAPDNAPPRSIYIRNAGVGSLTFTLSETSTRLFTVNPMSGSAPDSVHLTFKVLGGVVGQQYFDTLWVTSPEAVNSPYPVVFHFRIVDDPAVLALSMDTVKITSYGCPTDDFPIPSATFSVFNQGGDAPKVGNILYESDLVLVQPTSGLLPRSFTVRDLQPDLPSGVYYDTLIVWAEFAYGSPQMVIVEYTRINENPPASMLLSISSFDVPRQEQTGPASINIQITNANQGCMPWTVDEEIPWLAPVAASGNVPAALSCILQIDDLTLGTYTDSFYINAPLDPSGPQTVHVQVRMWRYHGDWNWDGRLDLSDLSANINYMINGSPQPQPTYAVGDTDCSGLVDLSDLSRLIAYFVPPGTAICGNP
ncbi:MAG: hypothetical protein NDJ18_04775 [candidate division Zixibacteria bacterium]|nr:hypothetical protein [candidate division Zixibacteria bacterium]